MLIEADLAKYVVRVGESQISAPFLPIVRYKKAERFQKAYTYFKIIRRSKIRPTVNGYVFQRLKVASSLEAHLLHRNAVAGCQRL